MSAEISTDAVVGAEERRRWLALAVIVAAQFMVVLDIAIVNVALPSIKTDLHFSQESLQWVITAYSIFFGGVLMLGGRLSDLLGRRRLFVAGLALFTVSSLLDGIAWSEGSLIAFRALQGLGAAMVSPAALSILTTTFREGRERNLALGIWGAASGSGGAAGVLLGGALTSALSWSWIFYINVPVGAFVAIELRSKAPLLPMRIFRLRTLSGANVAGLLLGGAVFSQFFLLTLYMQQVLHYSALKTGVAYVALTLAIITFSTVSQALALRVGIRRVLPVGLLMAAAALVLYARLPVHGHYFWDLFPAFLLSGVGLALAFVPMTIGALTGVRQSDAGIASGLINTSQQVGGAIGVAAATTIATTVTGHYVHTHAGTTALSGAALAHGFEIAFYALAAVAALAAIMAAVLIESRRAAPEVELIDTDAVALDAAA